MAKWVLIVVLVGAGGWYGYSKWRDHRASKVATVLAEVLCQTSLVKDGTAIVQQLNAASKAGNLQVKRDQLLGGTRALMARLDEEILKRGGKPADLKALFRGSGSALVRRAVPVADRVHETCPSVYNARQLDFQLVLGVIAAAAATR